MIFWFELAHSAEKEQIDVLYVVLRIHVLLVIPEVPKDRPAK